MPHKVVKELASIAGRLRVDAHRMRRFANSISHPEAIKSLLVYAVELDARAIELETKVAGLRAAVSGAAAKS